MAVTDPADAVPEADFHEQHIPLEADGAEVDDVDAALTGDTIIEVSEADLLEQHSVLPSDDDYPHGSVDDSAY